MVAPMIERTRSLVLALVVLVVVALAAPGAANAQATVACPDTFEVLHDDTVGALYLPKGHYRITVIGTGAPSCAEAADLFRQFLEDWNGKLPRPWVVDAQYSLFTRGAGGSVGFSVAATSSGGGGGGGGHHPSGGSACPGTFQVLHNDRIGAFAIRKGNYRLTLLSVGRISCSQASAYFARFLQDYDGVLPSPWVLDQETGTFMRGSRNVGFRIKGWVGPAHPSGGGHGVHPTGSRCPDTFRVLHNDSIGKLRLRKGPYRITLVGSGVSCARAAHLFTSFLEDFEGNLPKPWRLNVQTATFTRGGGSSAGFRVKPAR